MSSTLAPGHLTPHSRTDQSENSLASSLSRIVAALGSLKFACGLFVLAIVIVFIGSLAQGRRDVWQVTSDYFRCWIAWIDVADLFPPSLFPEYVEYDWNSLGRLRYLPFTGGWTVGALMLVNLIAAHSVRYSLNISTGRLLAGIGALLLGFGLTAAVVSTGNSYTGVQLGTNALTESQLWNLLLGVVGICGAALIGFGLLRGNRTRTERGLLIAGGALLLILLTSLMAAGDAARLSASSMRILWQLIKASVCATLLLIGAVLLFRKRGGVAVLHTGVVLLMVGELWVGLKARENLMEIVEGETTSELRDIREIELAIVRPGEDGKEQVTAIPEAWLTVNERSVSDNGTPTIVAPEGLPFRIRVREFIRNHRLRDRTPEDRTTATAGLGTFAAAQELDPVTGMDETPDISAVGIDLLEPESDTVIESLLVSQQLYDVQNEPFAEVLPLDGTDYRFYLRWKRDFRPYRVELLDVTREDYLGSNTPRNYESTVRITDNESQETNTYTLSMNNPLRYEGETFYQHNYIPPMGGKEATVLQVVDNRGWMLPYVSCMIVTFGMMYHFGGNLSRFLSRIPRRPGAVSTAFLVSAVCVALLSAGWVAGKLRRPALKENTPHVSVFGSLPATWSGRSQPIESFANTLLLSVSHKSTFVGEFCESELNAERDDLIEQIQDEWPDVSFSLSDFSGEYSDWIDEIARQTGSGTEAVEARLRDSMTGRMNGVRLLLDVAARPRLALRHRVIRIENDEVLAALGLQKRHSLTYSLEEILPKLDDLRDVRSRGLQLMRDKQDHKLTAFERKTVALFDAVGRVDSMRTMFEQPQTDELDDLLLTTWELIQQLENQTPAMLIPVGLEDDRKNSWETGVAAAFFQRTRAALRDAGVDSAEALQKWIDAELDSAVFDDAFLGTHRMLKDRLDQAQRAGTDLPENALQLQAGQTAMQIEDRFLALVLLQISLSDPEATAEEALSSVTAERKQQATSFRVPPKFRTDGVRMLDERAGHILFADELPPAFAAASEGLLGAVAAWEIDDVAAFNSHVDTYAAWLNDNDVPHLDTEKVLRESRFNHVDPFWKAIYLFLPAMLLVFLSWIVADKPLRGAALGAVIVGVLIMSWGLYERMAISGRPPVTNLYSSALFIGWAVALAALAGEWIVGAGIGILVSAVAGSSSLVIAHYLARGEGDTIGVMQAVLDTTFWLATHVVCITLGYAATFLAGFLGLAYIVGKVVQGFSGPSAGTEDAAAQQAVALQPGESPLAHLQSGPTAAALPPQKSRMERLGGLTYGVICFALFFSLVGTVLGGLWADDSWGRFWGWDPKENGALIIVLWNALILHARWDKQVGPYGMAVLSLIGNVVTAWSWFGVNELRAGLHSYGFTEGRLMALAVFCLSQIILATAALMLRNRIRRHSVPSA